MAKARAGPANPREAVLRPLASLASKSEKALARLAPGTWQRARLEANVAALRIALDLLPGGRSKGRRPSQADLAGAVRALASMAAVARKARAGFAPGTAHFPLQDNRLRALRAAQAAVRATLRAKAPRARPAAASPRRRLRQGIH